MTCVVKNDGLIGERKGVNMPNVNISLPAITERDRQDILFGLTENIDYIAASFIRDGESVRGIRELCRENGGEHVTIFPKIECALGVENFDEILEASDGIMVARGDLGIEIKPELVPHIQKEIIAKCNAAYKPVITATQMLDSMQQNPRPTRAEVADVANAIYDGTDAVMLSGESAAGKYPVEAVKMQASIALETEKYLPAHAPLEVPADAHGTRVVNNVVGMSAVNMATTVGAKCITVPTTTGRTARLISHFRPNMPICAFSRHEWAVQQMIMYWGVIPHQAEITQGTVNGTIVKAIETAKELGYVKIGDSRTRSPRPTSLTSLRCAKSHLQADLHCKGSGRLRLPDPFSVPMPAHGKTRTHFFTKSAKSTLRGPKNIAQALEVFTRWQDHTSRRADKSF